MGKPEFVYVTYIAKAPEKLWAALTRGEFTKAYWYGRRIESAWTVGSPVSFFDRDSHAALRISPWFQPWEPPGYIRFV